MFDFTGMMFNYEQRKVANDKLSNGAEIDTCAVNDSDQPFETAVHHPNYNGNNWIIVEMYDTKDEAAAGHHHWVDIMKADKLPKVLTDVSSCTILKLGDALTGGNMQRKFESK